MNRILKSGYSGGEGVSTVRRTRARLRLRAAAGILTALALLAAGPKGRPTLEPKPPLDFSGTWTLDPKASMNVSSQMRDAILSVRQTGNRIWISSVKAETGPRSRILSEEIVADARPYEKALGPAGKGLVTAGWARDGKSLWIEVAAGPPENPGEAIQRSVWRISEDGQVWIRESISVSKGHSGRARLVFRKTKA
jgi:hypothetical protein